MRTSRARARTRAPTRRRDELPARASATTRSRLDQRPHSTDATTDATESTTGSSGAAPPASTGAAATGDSDTGSCAAEPEPLPDACFEKPDCCCLDDLADGDRDGFPDACDSCPDVAGIGDACDFCPWSPHFGRVEETCCDPRGHDCVFFPGAISAVPYLRPRGAELRLRVRHRDQRLFDGRGLRGFLLRATHPMRALRRGAAASRLQLMRRRHRVRLEMVDRRQ